MRGYGVSTTVAPAGQQITRAHFLDSNENTVTAGYFETMGIDVLAGRALLERDTPADQPVPPVNVDVNQVFARRFFPNSNSLGRSFGTGAAGVARANYRIVGVVSDAKYRSLREPLVPTFYVAESLDGYLDSSIVLNVRTRGRPDSILEPVRKALAATDPTLAFREVHTMDDEVDASLSPDRLVAILASIFGSVAVLLAGVGLYGVFASALIQRRREIGVRMALGARPRHIGRLFGSEALVMSAIGIALGLGAALAAGPAIRSLLYGISPEDPASLAAAALFVVLVAAMGTAGPARRAVLIDPAAALRQDN
jgi:hypothetical protein